MTRDVAKLLNVKEGDRVVFVRRNGEILLKNAKSLG
ncbi:MAG: AbrB/MazE/SpoVT family DNA-binding domain-containing protein [Candidatus Freyarchaeota archaeon]